MEMQPVSAVQVNKFMLERAEEYPLCALVLLELRMGTVVKIMKNSEHLRDTKGCAFFFAQL